MKKYIRWNKYIKMKQWTKLFCLKEPSSASLTFKLPVACWEDAKSNRRLPGHQCNDGSIPVIFKIYISCTLHINTTWWRDAKSTRRLINTCDIKIYTLCTLYINTTMQQYIKMEQRKINKVIVFRRIINIINFKITCTMMVRLSRLWQMMKMLWKRVATPFSWV
jgi:hypothetical protein